MSTIVSPAQGVARLPGEALNSEGYRGLVGRWAPINQSPGGLLLYDSTRRGPPGAFTNMTVANWESSHLGPVIDFPANNSFVRVPFRAELEPLEVTARAVFRAGAGNGYILSKGTGVGTTDYSLRIDTLGVLVVGFNDGVGYNHPTANGVIVASQRYDVTFTIGNGRVRSWVNGALLVDAAEVNVMPQSGFDLGLGGRTPANSSFQGKLALVEIWNYCLPKPISLDPHFLARVNDGP